MNKIEQNELVQVSDLNRNFVAYKLQTADIELSLDRLQKQKIATIANLEMAAQHLAMYQEELTAKYGDITVNLQTGEYN
jgi:hypothetical protein